MIGMETTVGMVERCSKINSLGVWCKCVSFKCKLIASVASQFSCLVIEICMHVIQMQVKKKGWWCDAICFDIPLCVNEMQMSLDSM